MVGKIVTAIIAKLRNAVFYSFPDLKAAARKKLYEFSHNDFQKCEDSRSGAYLNEKEFLHPLPAVSYEIATWVYGRSSVNIDYHVVFEYNLYSCPYQYARKKVDLRMTDTYAGEVVERIFQTVAVKEQSFNPALAILRLSNKYTKARLEAACEFAITSGIRKPRYPILIPFWPPIKTSYIRKAEKRKRIPELLWDISRKVAFMREAAAIINDETKRKLHELNM